MLQCSATLLYSEICRSGLFGFWWLRIMILGPDCSASCSIRLGHSGKVRLYFIEAWEVQLQDSFGCSCKPTSTSWDTPSTSCIHGKSLSQIRQEWIGQPHCLG